MSEVAQILDSTAVSAPPTEPQTSAPQVDPQVSSKLEHLIRREQQALARERAAKQKELEVQDKYKKYEEFESLRTNPKKALEVLGLNNDSIAKMLLEDSQSAEPGSQIKQIMDQIHKINQRFDSEEQRRLEEQKRYAEEQQSAQIKGFKSDISQFLQDNKDKYELISFEGQEEMVFQLIEEHFNRAQKEHARELELNGEDPQGATGKILKVSEAADMVEKHLEEKYNKSRELNKVKALFGAAPKTAFQNAVQAAKAEQPKGPQSKTLTNNNSATQTPKPRGIITDEERIRRAIAYANSLRK